MTKTKIITCGEDQIILIPEELHTDAEEFYIRRIGEAYILYPADDPWYPLRSTIGTFPQDFLEDREQPF